MLICSWKQSCLAHVAQNELKTFRSKNAFVNSTAASVFKTAHQAFRALTSPHEANWGTRIRVPKPIYALVMIFN
eukprot:5837779-Amphidinium_carterae.1